MAHLTKEIMYELQYRERVGHNSNWHIYKEYVEFRQVKVKKKFLWFEWNSERPELIPEEELMATIEKDRKELQKSHRTRVVHFVFLYDDILYKVLDSD